MMERSRSSPDIIGRLQRELRQHSDQLTKLSNRDHAIDWLVPTLANSWVNFGGVEDTAAYSRTASGLVLLKGVIKTGAVPSTAFTLPEGFRPMKIMRFACVSNSAFAACSVDSTGVVTPYAGSNASFSLASVAFRAEQ